MREFSDLSSQYKAQVAENKARRQKLEKVERINSGSNWKTLYESLQVFYHILITQVAVEQCKVGVFSMKRSASFENISGLEIKAIC